MIYQSVREYTHNNYAEDNITPYESEKLAIGNFNTKAAASMKKSECNFALTIRIDDHTTSLNNITYGIKNYTNTSGYCTSMTIRTKAGADTVLNFNRISIKYLGKGSSFNVSSYSGYKNFTKNNFIVEPPEGQSSAGGSGTAVEFQFFKSYNSSTGAFSLTIKAVTFTSMAVTGTANVSSSCKVWLAPNGVQ